MGLTIHFALRAPTGTDSTGAAGIVRRMHKLACRSHRKGRIDRVGAVRASSSEVFGLSEYLIVNVPGDPHTSRGVEVPPEEGHVFDIMIGRGCEPLILGLCRYPTNVRDNVTGRTRRVRRSGWRLSGSCKTQYASLHGWEHFRLCHLAVVDLLVSFRSLGIRVTIRDEGGYWPGGNKASLKASVDRLNRLVAGMAGALLDACDEKAGPPVHSPIFGHPQFERIEAEGVARDGEAIGDAVRQVRDLRGLDGNAN